MNLLPTTIGPYTCTRDVIGSGAFALVMKGHCTADPSKPVAIKAIAKKNLCRRNSNLLEKEKKILKELTALKHNNLVALLHCEESSTHVLLVMEYCNAGDFADYLQLKKKLCENVIRHFLMQIAQALKVIHSCGIVHRDLKPQNILMSTPDDEQCASSAENFTLKIADFGFARFLQSGVMAGTLCGSPMYMAPEVLMSLQYDAKADLWSIGTIVYQCLVGCAPFQARSPTVLRQFYEHNQDLNPRIPHSASREFTDLTRRLLCKNPSRRLSLDELLSHPFLALPKEQEYLQYKSPLKSIKRFKSVRDDSWETFEIVEFSQSAMGGEFPLQDGSPSTNDEDAMERQMRSHTIVNLSDADSQLAEKGKFSMDDLSILSLSSLRHQPGDEESVDCSEKQFLPEINQRSTSDQQSQSQLDDEPDSFAKVKFISDTVDYLARLMSKSPNPLMRNTTEPDIATACSLSIKCMDLISGTVAFIKSEIAKQHLPVSRELINHVELFNKQYKQCLAIVNKARRLHRTQASESVDSINLPSADRIILKHALDLCMRSICD